MTSAMIVYSVRLPLSISIPTNPPSPFSSNSQQKPSTVISMAEEFQESDVIFQDNADCDGAACSYTSSRRESRNGRGKRRKLIAVSVPVSIPARNECFRCAEAECDYGGDDGEMVPPHVIVGRRVAGKMMALSICTGKGRVVKGRDLREFRNLVLRVTGFLET